MGKTQVSGSLALDMSGLAATIERAVQGATQALAHSMAQLRRDLDAMAASANRRTLSEDEMVATLSCHLPAGLSTDALGDGSRIAAFQAQRLAAAGYALVAVSGPALEHAVRTGNVLADFTHAAKTAAGVPVSPGRGGTINVNGSPMTVVEYVTAPSGSAEYLNTAALPELPPKWSEYEERAARHPAPCGYPDMDPCICPRVERADERLEQARRDGAADSWFEDED